jgi:hypothetical protein
VSVDIAWYVARLRVMSGAELVHRVRERWQVRALERSQRRFDTDPTERRPASFSFCTSAASVLPRLTWDVAANHAIADDLLAGRWNALAFDWRWFDSPDVWHRAPDTGNPWPRTYFARIHYRQGNPYGDARVVWEPSRLQQLVSLALLCGNEKRRTPAVALIERQLQGWLEANPPYVGVHYVSAMECALRLIAACHAIDMVRSWLAEPARTWTALVCLVDSHARLIHRRLSLHSSATNHTVAEAAGLVYAGSLFPEFEDAGRWRETGTALLAAEVERQILDDGGGVEQAPGYLEQIADLATLAGHLVDRERAAAIAERVGLARRFLAELAGGRNERPALGDDDGGRALSPFWKATRPSAPPLRPSVTFVNTGYTILRSRPDGRRQIGFDHGPLGLEPAFAHGHADALSLTWRDGDRELLVDPGTYSYTGQPEWRRYFRGARAHNTVVVDRKDHTTQRGPFLWRPGYGARLVRAAAGAHSVVLACHDGYRHERLRHWRGLVYDHVDRLVVWDRLEGRGEHEISMWWHFGVDVGVEGRTVSSPTGAITMLLPVGDLVRHHGSNEPMAGWRSPRYGEKFPITTVEARAVVALPATFCTLILARADEAPATTPAEIAHLGTLERWADEA